MFFSSQENVINQIEIFFNLVFCFQLLLCCKYNFIMINWNNAICNEKEKKNYIKLIIINKIKYSLSDKWSNRLTLEINKDKNSFFAHNVSKYLILLNKI